MKDKDLDNKIYKNLFNNDNHDNLYNKKFDNIDSHKIIDKKINNDVIFNKKIDKKMENINPNIKVHIDSYKIYVAKKYYVIYNYLKESDIIKDSYDPVEYLRDLSNSYYVINGRQMTDEEIIAYELHKIQKSLITDDYENNKYRAQISYFYNKLRKTRITYKKEKYGLYRSYINIICCLLGELPPFLDDIYEQCSRIENRKYKVIRK